MPKRRDWGIVRREYILVTLRYVVVVVRVKLILRRSEEPGERLFRVFSAAKEVGLETPSYQRINLYIRSFGLFRCFPSFHSIP